MMLNILVLPLIFTSQTKLYSCYLTASFEMKSHLIETKEFAEAHTGEMISEALQQVLAEWNLDDNRLVVATF